MKQLKTILFGIVLGAMALVAITLFSPAPAAHAQPYGGIPGASGVGGAQPTIAVASGTNLAGNIDVRFCQNVAIELAYKLTTLSTSNTVGVAFAWSLDGTTYDPNKLVTISTTSTGTTLLRTNQTFSTGAYMYLIPLWATNSGLAGVVTNLSIRYATKNGI
jgi:hypothetical protein